MTEPYYSDSSVTLYLGDCREITDWLAADVLVTDPPYGLAITSGTMGGSSQQTISGDDSPLLRDEALALWGKRPALVFGSWRVTRPRGVNNRLIWHKAGNVPAMRTQPWYSADEEIYQLGTGFTGRPEQNVLVSHDKRDGSRGEVARYGHPTPKPVGLMERLIGKCPPGVIADPFAGVGSTLVAAKLAGRSAIGVELVERYCEMSARRLDQGVLDFDEVSA